MIRCPLRMGWLLLACLLLALPAGAQLSPGKLARPHAALEGLTKCTSCHELGKSVSDDRCLVCHTEIKDRAGAEHSVHSRKELSGKTCASCHSDHHGLDFELIHWPDGQEAFDHSRTAFELKEAHGELDCRKCHKPELQRTDLVTRYPNLVPERSFLGLQSECQACHTDPHKESLGADCLRCHGQTAWDRLPGFKHEDSWPLEGAHSKVECAKCHRFPAGMTDKDPLNGARTWTGLAHDACVDCHTDPHETRFGNNCLDCHSMSSFKDAGGGFDHSRTRWPLTGAHVKVSCASCHGNKREKMTMAFAACKDCHDGPHGTQFNLPAEKARACEACHIDARWKPARFGFQAHAEAGWPLEGAHGAIPCALCHTLEKDNKVIQYRGLASACVDCHDTPHGERPAEESCEQCHTPNDWTLADYDHGETRFPLKGKHARVSCRDCHRAEEEATAVPLSGWDLSCLGCHEDRHDGQFAEGETHGACESCHSEDGFKPATFDHQSQSRFALEGAHQGLACALCHASRERADGTLDRIYRPLPFACVDCHGKTGGPDDELKEGGTAP